MVSGTRCPSVCVCSDVVNGRGAAAPEDLSDLKSCLSDLKSDLSDLKWKIVLCGIIGHLPLRGRCPKREKERKKSGKGGSLLLAAEMIRKNAEKDKFD